MTSSHPAEVLSALAHWGYAGEALTSSALLVSVSAPDASPSLLPEDEDQDTGDLPTGVDEDQLNHDELDTDQLTSPD